MNYRNKQKLSHCKRSATFLRSSAVFVLLMLCVVGCFDNNPYPSEDIEQKTFFYNFTQEPDTLDPAKAYSSDLLLFIEQIYEPTLQFHYLKRPSELEALTAETVPEAIRYDKDGNKLDLDAPHENIDKVVYRIKLKKGILYQDHPAFSVDKQGKHIWHLGSHESFAINGKHPDELFSLPRSKDAVKHTRELNAADYIYQFKRMADPKNECPIVDLLSTHVKGFKDLAKKIESDHDKLKLSKANKILISNEQDDSPTLTKKETYFIDYSDNAYDIPGLKLIDDYTFEVVLNKPYPQFRYWMAMAFFSPVPWEVDRFYLQNASQEKNLSIKRFPVGTGPYKIVENTGNFRIVLERNKNFRKAYYPTVGEESAKASDKKKGLLDAAGKQVPFIDRAVFTLEKENMPRWNKFRQGYYDLLEPHQLGSDQFDSAVNITADGAEASPDMAARDIRLLQGKRPYVRYFAFNMKDKVVGGYTEQQIKLRQAISIAFNVQDQIDIHASGNGVVQHGPLPEGIFGYRPDEAGMNKVLNKWDPKKRQAVKLEIAKAKKLMVEAGYANGIDPKTGKRLEIKYNIPDTAGSKTLANFVKKQFSLIDIGIEIIQYTQNKWKEELKTGNYQLIWYGWFADYPDPENFLFLLYGPNSSIDNGGANYANYNSPEYNKMFKQIETMPNSPKRLEIIDKMQALVQKDCPWIFGYNPITFTMHQGWLKNYKPKFIGGGYMKYWDIDPKMRKIHLKKNNKPVTWPVWITLGSPCI